MGRITRKRVSSAIATPSSDNKENDPAGTNAMNSPRPGSGKKVRRSPRNHPNPSPLSTSLTSNTLTGRIERTEKEKEQEKEQEREKEKGERKALSSKEREALNYQLDNQLEFIDLEVEERLLSFKLNAEAQLHKLKTKLMAQLKLLPTKVRNMPLSIFINNYSGDVALAMQEPVLQKQRELEEWTMMSTRKMAREAAVNAGLATGMDAPPTVSRPITTTSHGPFSTVEEQPGACDISLNMSVVGVNMAVGGTARKKHTSRRAHLEALGLANTLVCGPFGLDTPAHNTRSRMMRPRGVQMTPALHVEPVGRVTRSRAAGCPSTIKKPL